MEQHFPDVQLSITADFYLDAIGGAKAIHAINRDLANLQEIACDIEDEIILGGIKFRRLDSGLFRTVFVDSKKRIVLKFQDDMYYYSYHDDAIETRGNLTEWEVYRIACQRGVQQHFAACIAFLNGWKHGPVLVQEFVPGEYDRDYYDHSHIKATEERYTQMLGGYIQAADVGASNMRGDKVVDYGNFGVYDEFFYSRLIETYDGMWE